MITMGGTYDGAYTSNHAPSDLTYMTDSKKSEPYKVLAATRTYIHHYHGSWFEYTWRLTLSDAKGKIIKETWDTWEYTTNWIGKNIVHDGTTFKMLKEG
jgi:hypothetical protein